MISIFPKPESLSETSVSLKRKIISRKLTILIISALGLIHLATTETFGDLPQTFIDEWGFFFDSKTKVLNFKGFFVSPFLHLNYLHLMSNTLGLIILSFSESKMTSRVYLNILLFGTLGGFLSPFAYLGAKSIGFSGAIYGLLAAVVIEYTSKRRRDFFFALLAILGVMSYTIFTEAKSIRDSYSFTDHFAHIGGAVTVLIYCWFRAKKK